MSTARTYRLSPIIGVLLLAGCRREAPPGPVASHRPNVLIITVDTTRADRIGCYGYALARTPHMDALAAEGVLCKDATTAVPITLPSHSTILTGLYPPAHGVRDNGAYALGDDVVTLAERLKEVGYRTQAFVSALVLNRRYNLTQGFESYDDDLWTEDAPPMFMIRDRPAPKTAGLVVTWLDQWYTEKDRAPFFIWTHFFDPHQPYDPKVPNRWLLPSDYDAEIAQADMGVGMIIDNLKTKGVLDDTMVVLVADHGESLGEHGEKTHALFIYDATIRVPLLWRYPKLLPQGKVYEGAVRTVDIVPTILSLLVLPGGDETQGVNLAEAFRGEMDPPELSHYCESLLCEVGFGMAPLYGVRRGGYKWIRAPKPEVYDLKKDPKELENLYADEAKTAKDLDTELQSILEDSKRYTTQAKENPMDKETMDMLFALGYLAPAAERKGMGGIDPKDGIVLHNKLERARDLARGGDWKAVERPVRELLEVTPANVSARNVLALALVNQGKLKEAEKEYAASLATDPKQHRVFGSLALINVRLGELDKAEQLYLKSLQLAPKFVDAVVGLGFIEKKRGNADQAEAWYKKALELDPSFPHAHRRYADLHFMREEYAEALVCYKKTLEALPEHFEAMNQAGLCAKRMGDHATAIQYLERARRLQPDAWVPLYNLACIQALDDHSQAALATLDAAADKGFRNPALLQKDKDLTSVRTLPGYPDLLQKVTEAGKKARRQENESE